jgi:predicted glycosyltransferase
MNILIDIGHPGHVHLLHGVAEEMIARGHKVFYSVRDIPVAKRLMEHYRMTPWVDLGGKKDSLTGKAQTVLHQDIQLLKFVQRNHINIGLSSGIVLSHVSKLTSMKAYVFDDDDDAAEPLIVKYGHPLSDVVFTPDCIRRKTKHAVYYAGTHELAYLHPKRFSPNPVVLQHAGIQEDERFFIMRFVALKGHHDVGQQGLTMDQKKALVALLKKHGRVIITSERTIEPEFEQYRLPVPPEEIHSLMAYSAMFLGDSQTMTSEAAVLGVPALKCNTFAGRLSVPNMLENKYGLCYAYQPQQFDEMYHHIEQLLAKDPEELRNEWHAKQQRMIDDMIDPTDFFVNYIENNESLS